MYKNLRVSIDNNANRLYCVAMNVTINRNIIINYWRKNG